MASLTSPLTTDLYELNMVQAYLDRGEDKEAVFEVLRAAAATPARFSARRRLEDVLTILRRYGSPL